jgi:hypothetical protein
MYIPRGKQVPTVSAPQARGTFNHIARIHFIFSGHGELSDLARKHALVTDGIQKHAPILDWLEFAIACLISQILGPGVTGCYTNS